MIEKLKPVHSPYEKTDKINEIIDWINSPKHLICGRPSNECQCESPESTGDKHE